MAYKIKIQFRRDTAANWELNKHVVPLEGEPCFETDTGVFKIGDGVTAYGDLVAIGNGLSEDSTVIKEYLSKIETFENSYEKVKYEITDVPVGTLVNIDESEIRVMCPADTVFTKQAVGAGGDANTYYMTFKTYAPSDDVVGYIEHLNGQVDEEILTTFSTDEYGRRYQPTWLGLAKYDETTDSWTYYGANSSKEKYIGWDYQIDWYNADGIIIASDSVRINLSNEDCHSVIEPYYMGKVIKGITVNGEEVPVADSIAFIPVATDNTLGMVKGGSEIFIKEDGSLEVNAISFSKILQGEDAIVFDGGSSEN